MGPLQTLLLVILLWTTQFVLRRTILHPLRKYPGPTLAKLTRWYAGYFDVYKHGDFLRHTTWLHQTYGVDVLRIGPNELHFRNPKAYMDIHAPGSKFSKSPKFYRAFGVELSGFGAVDFQTHRGRREAMSSMFSRKSILSLERLLRYKVDDLIAQLLLPENAQRPVAIGQAIRCCTLDMISSYLFDERLNAIQSPDFRHPFLTSLESAIPSFWVCKYLSWILPLVNDTPPWLMRLLPSLGAVFEFRHKMKVQIQEILDDVTVLGRSSHVTVYQQLLEGRGVASSVLGSARGMKREYTKDELFQEGLALLLAGSDTVGTASTVAIVSVLSDRMVYERLSAELRSAWEDVREECGIEKLEKLPLLTAVIKESLRLAGGVVSSAPRITGSETSIIDGVAVPPHTVVSTSATYVHYDPTTFPDPSSFKPDRWLGTNTAGLDAHLVAFGRGPRSCLGVNLAWSELYLILGNLFRKLELQLYDTSAEDVKQFDDFFVAVFKKKILQVTVTGIRTT